MAIECGSQSPICDLPVHFDTYRGCTHRCAYCFAVRKESLRNKKVVPIFGEKHLRDFCNGKQTKETAWVDWKIPLHWGGMSDPFQPCEKKFGVSKKALEIFAETQYPFVVSTKGRIIAEPEYLELISRCNAVVQISMLCSAYDKIEEGCPTFEERLEILKAVSKVAKRTIVRCQPYTRVHFEEIKANIQRFAECGAYGVIFEGMKFIKKADGMEKIGGDYVYPMKDLRADFVLLKAECHKYGLKFFSGENRLRAMGDSLCCCGVEGVKGFQPNHFNLSRLLNGERPRPTKGQCAKDSGYRNLHHCNQVSGNSKYRGISFKDFILKEYRDKKALYLKVFGKE